MDFLKNASHFVGTDKRACSQNRAHWLTGNPKMDELRAHLPYRLVQVPPGYCVVDIDDKDKVPSWFLALPTVKVKTPNGVHLWFRVPTPVDIPNVISFMSEAPRVSAAKTGSMSADGDTIERTADFLTAGCFAVIPPSPGYEQYGHERTPMALPPAVLAFVWDALCRVDKLPAIPPTTMGELFTSSDEPPTPTDEEAQAEADRRHYRRHEAGERGCF